MRHPLRLKIKYVNLSGGQDLGLPHLFHCPPRCLVWGLVLNTLDQDQRWRERREEQGRITDGNQDQRYRCRSADSLYHNLFLKNDICFVYIISLEGGEMQKCPSLHPFSPPSLLPHVAFSFLAFSCRDDGELPFPSGHEEGSHGKGGRRSKQRWGRRLNFYSESKGNQGRIFKQEGGSWIAFWKGPSGRTCTTKGHQVPLLPFLPPFPSHCTQRAFTLPAESGSQIRTPCARALFH